MARHLGSWLQGKAERVLDYTSDHEARAPSSAFRDIVLGSTVSAGVTHVAVGVEEEGVRSACPLTLQSAPLTAVDTKESL